MTRYAVVIEKGAKCYGAYVPDLPGCVAIAKTLSKVQELIEEAISFHIESLVLHGEKVPMPSTSVTYSDVGASAGTKRSRKMKSPNEA